MKCSPHAIGLAVLILAALALRGGVAWRLSGNLSEDRDAYLAIARSLAAGEGFSASPSGEPTAYRPPLYPIVVAGLLKLGGGTAAIAVLHVLVGTGTVLLTWLLGRRLGMRSGALIAAAIVAVDPLLLWYTSFPMTETVFTLLVAALLAIGVGRATAAPPLDKGGPGGVGTAEPLPSATVPPPTPPYQGGEPPRDRRVLGAIGTGVLFGLAALCRPTMWAFGALVGGWWVWTRIRSAVAARSDRAAERQVARAGFARSARRPLIVAATVAVIVSPWLVRNLAVFGRPILTTTHGGYTLLLGNNPVFYREVVEQPWGTVWQGESLAAWQQSIDAEMRRAEPPALTEPERDRWMSRRALANIAGEPGGFLRACWLRFRRFWNVMPLGPAGETVSPAMRWGVGLFYSVVTAGMILGLLRLSRVEWRRWMPLVLLIIGFTSVHLVYWSNTRMRAPLVPAIALLAVRGWTGRSRGRKDSG